MSRFTDAFRVLLGKPLPRKVGRTSNNFASRMYKAAQNSRLTGGFISSNSSADNESVTSLTTMRARSRALCRDSSYAKRARMVVVNNIIGTGVGMQAQVMSERDTLHTRVNDSIEEAWAEWCEADNCHTGGRLSFKHFERALQAQIFEAGEVFVRKHYKPFGKMGLPFSLELIEAERLADDLSMLPDMPRNGNFIRMGIELDKYYRPVAYYFRTRHPGEIGLQTYANDSIERVPAEQVIHLAPVDRWPQTRGEPWMHTAMLRLNDMEGYSSAEIVRARSQAIRMGFIETPDSSANYADDELDDGSLEITLEAGTVEKLNPGEKWVDSQPTAPNPNMDPFMRYMLREVAAGIGISYESLSRDYSQSNYSSSRLALLDDRDVWRFHQSWFTCDFRVALHKEWLRQAVFSEHIEAITVEQYALNPRKYEAALFKPRGWSWIDPTAEVEAYKEAIRGGLTTRGIVVAETANGLDIEDIDRLRERELKDAKARGLEFDTDPDYYMTEAVKAEAAKKQAAKPAPAPATPAAPGKPADSAASANKGRGALEVIK